MGLKSALGLKNPNHTKSLSSSPVSQNILFYLSKVYIYFAAFLLGKKKNFKVSIHPMKVYNTCI